MTNGLGSVPVFGWKKAGEKEDEDPNGDYVKLKDGDLVEDGFGGATDRGLGLGSASASSSSSSSSSCCSRWWCSIWWWAKLVLLVAFLGVLAAVFFKWIGPFFMDKVQRNSI